MHQRQWRAPSPALVISLIALFVALGGTTYAATNLPKNSVGTKQLKKNAVTAVKIKKGAVTATKIDAKGLTVPNALHASSADSATNATNAVNATSAPPIGLAGGDLMGSYPSPSLAVGAVTGAKLAAGAVTGAKVAANSLSLSDLVGTDVSGSISFFLSANSCGLLSMAVSGASAGQAAILTWTGPIPSDVVVGPLEVTSATAVQGVACNLASSDVSLSGVGVRLVTFG